jgi:hypothetical protein
MCKKRLDLRKRAFYWFWAARSAQRSTMKPIVLQALMKLLVELLAIPLGNHKTIAKWLVIAIPLSQQAGKWLVMPATCISVRGQSPLLRPG